MWIALRSGRKPSLDDCRGIVRKACSKKRTRKERSLVQTLATSPLVDVQHSMVAWLYALAGYDCSLCYPPRTSAIVFLVLWCILTWPAWQDGGVLGHKDMQRFVFYFFYFTLPAPSKC